MKRNMDELEKFVKKNRDELDQYPVPEKIWQEIESDLRKTKVARMLKLSAAAVILILMGSTALFYIYRTGQFAGKPGPDEVNTILNPDSHLREAEIYYKNVIHDLYDQAMPLLSSDQEMKNELNYDLSKLDTICMEIRKDLKDNVSNQEVIEALINNYRIRIRILNDMLDRLRQNEDNHEKSKNNAL